MIYFLIGLCDYKDWQVQNLQVGQQPRDPRPSIKVQRPFAVEFPFAWGR